MTYRIEVYCISTRVISSSPTLNFISSHGGFKPAPTPAKGRTFFMSEEETNTCYSSSPIRTPLLIKLIGWSLLCSHRTRAGSSEPSLEQEAALLPTHAENPSSPFTSQKSRSRYHSAQLSISGLDLHSAAFLKKKSNSSSTQDR